MKLTVSAREKWPISPYLNMQFMEPLGVTDSSVDAGWDYLHECWKPELLDLVRSLAPGMVRWGGCFASYYHWREGVGPMADRKPMLNLLWGGVYSNAVGTREIVDFCRRVQAEPLMVFNTESDGRMYWAYPKPGEDRFGTAEEAAAWVRYCNDPDDALRKRHDPSGPYDIRWWQIGNETSYDKKGYQMEKAVEVTRRFAEKALEADPGVHLILWGDSGWAGPMCEAVGGMARHVAFHCDYRSTLADSPLYDIEYRRDPARTWEHMMSAPAILTEKLAGMRTQVQPYGKRLALTEGHFAIPGRNRCDVLSSWIAGAAYGRLHNVILRASDILDIATLADFFGTRWQVNAILIPTPEGKPYLQPVGQIMRLFGRYCGDHYAEVSAGPEVDAAASIRDRTAFVHLVNPRMDRAMPLEMELDNGAPIRSIRVHEIAPEDVTTEITPQNPDCFDPVTRETDGDRYTLPAAAAAVLEIGF